MTKEEFILDASMKLMLELIKEGDYDDELEELAKSCANSAKKIWEIANLTTGCK